MQEHRADQGGDVVAAPGFSAYQGWESLQLHRCW